MFSLKIIKAMKLVNLFLLFLVIFMKNSTQFPAEENPPIDIIEDKIPSESINGTIPTAEMPKL